MLFRVTIRNRKGLKLYKDLTTIDLNKSMSNDRQLAQKLADKICSGPKSSKPIPNLEIASIKAAVSDDSISLKAIYEELKSLKGSVTDGLDCPDTTMNSPLIWAADAGNTSVVDYLASIEEVDIFRKGFLGNTALSRASRNGHYDIVKILLEEANKRSNSTFGACSLGNVHNDKLQYPIHFASFYEHPKILELMLSLGFDTTVKDRRGRTPLEDTKSEIIKNMILKSRETI